LENTQKIAALCNLQIEMGSPILPHIEVPDGYDEDSYLKKICDEGLAKYYKSEEITEEVKERLEFELSVIRKMKFSSYFLIVADFVNWAKNNGIVVGPGRGSAAGSLVCYLSGITNLDPIKYELLFERFLNPDRISMPDIDLDFADIRRDEVIRYVEGKYGKEHVAQIITFGTMAARAAVRDVGRVLGYPYDFCDKLAKSIPMMMKLDRALKASSELKEMYENDENARKILDYAKKLEGVARHSSTHACGVLITKEPLTEYVPLQFASSSDRTIVSQYSLHPIEDLGLLKMDFLGLANLTIIESAIKIIAKTRGLQIRIGEIPLDDGLTYALFQKGETTGVFQFESSGMKRYLRELVPSTFEDLIAMVALYRPGPMELIPDYIARKHQKKKITYLHKDLEPILRKTYGVAIYQEQVMQISRYLAGFTRGEADVLRKAMGKKIAVLLAEQKEKFIEGCIKNGINKELAEKIWAFIEPFAGYGFNRSHAACYAMIAYQTAYLKAHWPTEFMAALLTSDQGNTDRVAIEIEECRNMGIEVLAPDINQSYESFTVVTSGTAKNLQASENEKVNTIRFGLKAIKNVGHNIAEVTIAERKKAGPFLNLTDLLKRIQDKDFNKKSLESLIKTGCLDAFGERGSLLENIETMLNYNKERAKSSQSAQKSLFGDMPLANYTETIKLKKTDPASRQAKLAWEKELLGLYISEHPFLDYKKELGEKTIPIKRLNSIKTNDEVLVAGIISSIKKIITKNNETMAFIKIEDDTDSIELLAFPRLFKEHNVWQEGRVLICRGKLSDKDNENKILCNAVKELEAGLIDEIIKELRAPIRQNSNGPPQSFSGNKPMELGKDLFLLIKNNIATGRLKELYALLANYKGNNKVYFKIKNGGNKVKTLESGFNIANSLNLKQAIRDNFSDLVEVLDSKR